MKGAIIFSSKYGSTSQYANWIGEETGLPLFNLTSDKVDPSAFDFLVLGSPIYYYHPLSRKWLIANKALILERPTVLFTVSGAPPGPKLSGWLAKSLPADLVAHMDHIALGGRQNRRKIGWLERLALSIASLVNPDPLSAKEEAEGFDYVEQSAIQPVVELIKKYQNPTPANPPGSN